MVVFLEWYILTHRIRPTIESELSNGVRTIHTNFDVPLFERHTDAPYSIQDLIFCGNDPVLSVPSNGFHKTGC